MARKHERRDTGATEVHETRHDDRYDDRRHDERRYDDRPHGEAAARDKFGGINWGACFFGWLVAIGVSILLTSIIGAILTAVGSSISVTQTEAERQAGTIGIVSAAVLLAILLIGYYTGGYVAGRMSRFDGGKQGIGVWLIGLIITILAIVAGAVFGSQYNILQRVSLPSIPVSGEAAGWGALIAAAAILVGTLLVAFLGGKAGHRYHNRVDRAVRS